MALTSTLVIDTCESFQRTEANYITSWFARLSIATGPIIAWLVDDFSDMHLIFPLASLLALGAFVLVSLVKFPFKAPAEHLPLFSYDRFFLPQGIPLFINIVLILIGAGMYFAIPHNLTVYLMFLLGLLMAIVAEKYVFADADLKSQARGLGINGSSRIHFIKRPGFCRRGACALAARYGNRCDR